MRELIPACPRTTALDDDRPQTLGGTVDGCGEPGRTGADDDEVVVRELLVRLEADPFRQLGRIGADERLGVRDERRPAAGPR